MENPGLRVYLPQYIKVSYRVTAAPPPMATPHTESIEGYQTGIEDMYAIQRENVMTGPPLSGGTSADPVSALNGGEGQDPDRDIYRAAGAAETQVPGETRTKFKPVDTQPSMEDLAEQQMGAAEQRRIDHQKMVGGGSMENPSYDEAQDRIREKMMLRRSHPLHRTATDDEWHDSYGPTEITPEERDLMPAVASTCVVAHHDPDQDIKDVLAVQGAHGNWDFDEYMHGMFNGMELVGAIHDRREPEFREAPDTWGRDKYEAERAKKAAAVTHPLFRTATTPESDDEFWARMEREHPGQQNTSPYMQSPDAVAQSFDDHDFEPGDDWHDTELDEMIPERMSLRDHAKLLRSETYKWDGNLRYPSYTHQIPRSVIMADGERGHAHEGHVIEHNTNNRGPALPDRDYEPGPLEYPWTHSYYPAGHTDDQGWVKGYNSLDQAMHTANHLANWGPHHSQSVEMLNGYKRIGDDADYEPGSIEAKYGRG